MQLGLEAQTLLRVMDSDRAVPLATVARVAARLPAIRELLLALGLRAVHVHVRGGVCFPLNFSSRHLTAECTQLCNFGRQS